MKHDDFLPYLNKTVTITTPHLNRNQSFWLQRGILTNIGEDSITLESALKVISIKMDYVLAIETDVKSQCDNKGEINDEKKEDSRISTRSEHKL